MATYDYFLEGVMPHIRVRPVKNGDTAHTVKMASERETFVDASLGDSPSLQSYIHQSQTHRGLVHQRFPST